jgi:hypothetical protein
LANIEIPGGDLERFFMRIRRLERFKGAVDGCEIGMLNVIMEREEALVQKSLIEFQEYGIDGMKFLRSARGQAEYLAYCSFDDAKEECFSRCYSCEKFSYDGRTMDCFGSMVVFSEKCKEHIDTGEMFEKRLIDAYDRCVECLNADVVKIYDHNDVSCHLKKNMFAINCEYRKEKE